jgi:hypothetical protein
MKSKRFSNVGRKGPKRRRKSRRTALHAKNLCSKAHNFRLAPPKCPSHVGRNMERIGEISKTRHQGKLEILGYRFRCPILGCPACATILFDESGEMGTSSDVAK